MHKYTYTYIYIYVCIYKYILTNIGINKDSKNVFQDSFKHATKQNA